MGAPTGILDQSASVLCTAGHALFLDTRDLVSEQVPLDLAAAGLALLVVDSGVAHDHAEGGYGDRRRECEEAAARLGVALLREVDDVAGLAALADGTPEGDLLLRRARHIVTENARVLEVVAAAAGDADPRTIGPMLTAGHASLRDDFEISIPCWTPASRRPSGRARTVPAWSGAASVAARSPSSRRPRSTPSTAAVAERFAREGRPAPRTFVTVPSAGARRLA